MKVDASKMTGWVEVPFTGGTLDGQTRYVRHPVERGSRFNVIVTGEVWEWDGRTFRLVWDGQP